MEKQRLIKLLVIDDEKQASELEDYSTRGVGATYVDVRKVCGQLPVDYLVHSWRPSALVIDAESARVEEIVETYGAHSMVIVTTSTLDYNYAGTMIAKGASAVIKKPNNDESYNFLIDNIKDLNPPFEAIQ